VYTCKGRTRRARRVAESDAGSARGTLFERRRRRGWRPAACSEASRLAVGLTRRAFHGSSAHTVGDDDEVFHPCDCTRKRTGRHRVQSGSGTSARFSSSWSRGRRGMRADTARSSHEAEGSRCNFSFPMSSSTGGQQAAFRFSGQPLDYIRGQEQRQNVQVIAARRYAARTASAAMSPRFARKLS